MSATRPRLPRDLPRRLGAISLALWGLVPVAAWQMDAAALGAFLRTTLGISDRDVSAIAGGKAVVKTLPSADKREVTTAGAVRIKAPSEGFVSRFRTLEGFRTSQFVQQIARFSDPPQLGDLDALVIDREDFDAFRECQVGDCGVRLPADHIRRFAAEIDWRAPDAPVKASTLYKTMLYGYLMSYRSGGLSRLFPYADQEQPLDLASELRSLLDGPSSPLASAPAFRDHVSAFPGRALAETEDFFYWSKETFGFKPVVGLYHVSLHTPANGEVFIVTLQIYASHYMDGQVATNVVLPDPVTGDAGFYWLYFNRARIGRLEGFLGTLSRPIVQRRARSGLSKSLEQTRDRMEGRRQQD